MRRVLSIWFPQLPLDRLVRGADPRVTGPFAIIVEIKNAWRLSHLSAAARSAGLTEGLSVPDARAICPDLLTEKSDLLAEANMLRALWRWADCLSPAIAVDKPDGLLLDITGCAHLFGGEQPMAEYTMIRLTDMQLVARVAIADSKGCAWALSRFGRQTIELAAPGETANALQDIPLAGLNLAAKTVRDLRRTGIKSIGQLYPFRSAELARRFGLELTKTLSKTLGHEPDPVSPKSADPVYAARMTMPEPIGLTKDLQEVLQRLSDSVCGRLQKSQRGARRYHLIVRCVDSGDHILTVGFAQPCHDTIAVMQQFRQPLEKLKIVFGADWFRLLAEKIEPMHPLQMGFDKQPSLHEDTAKIISTLGNRLGFDRVRQFVALDSYLPEREFCSIQMMDQHRDRAWKNAPRRRPLRLFPHPERLQMLVAGRPPKQFQWRRDSYATVTAEGPERLVPEWWQDENLHPRDYWYVQTDSGLRLWLLTYPALQNPQWFVAGRFP